MAWCLYEAMRDDERNFLRRADCMSVLQDSRGNDVLTRYVACGGGPRKLEVRTGILQLQVGRAAGAVDLQRALLRSLKSMATKRKPHSNMYRTREEPSCDTALLDHLRSICEVYASDAAADEQLAGQMLRPDSGRTGCEAQLPNLRLVIRDAAHASRRLLSRTWCQDPYIKRLLDALLWNKNSLAKTIRYTRVFQDLFLHHQRERRTDPAQPIIKNLAFAKQRFDSLAKPLARLVQHFDSALDVVADILRERGRASPEHVNAARLVDILDSEAMLQMGMLADCAELLSLIHI